MAALEAITIILFSGIAGVVGWRAATRTIDHRSPNDLTQPGHRRRRTKSRYRKLRRLVVTILCAIVGAVLAVVFLRLVGG